jgi:hypothetical protein
MIETLTSNNGNLTIGGPLKHCQASGYFDVFLLAAAVALRAISPLALQKPPPVNALSYERMLSACYIIFRSRNTPRCQFGEPAVEPA